MKHKQNNRRNVSGVLLLDKPIGYSSNGALQIVKKIFGANKAGHTGSLDPNATGMLPLCFGEATKFSQFLLESNKRYLVTGKLGEVTASGDSESAIITKREVGNIDMGSIEKILPKFRGKILQLPPMYSAIKHQGQPLYKLARQGIEVERNKRAVDIYKLELLGFGNNLASFDIYCSKGTYVRTLIVDIGEVLGCGAHVVALRRLEVGPYREAQMVTLEKLQELAMKGDFSLLDQHLLPIESMLVGMAEVTLTVDMVHYALLGQSFLVAHAPVSGWVKLLNKNGQFVGVGEVIEDGKISPRRMCRL